MHVILLEKIPNLGPLGQVVNVKPGYARNYLIPQGKARPATAAALAEFEARRAELEAKAAEVLAAAQARAEGFEGKTFNVVAKAGPEGKLFGSVGAPDIADAIEASGLTIERREVRLPEGPIRMTGPFLVEVVLHADVIVPVQVTVSAG